MKFILNFPDFSLVPENTTELDCSNIGLTSLYGCLENIIKLDCNFNNLRNLDGCPKSVKELFCNYNQLTTLRGCSDNVEILMCNCNNLLTLEGCSKNAKIISCFDNNLISLKGCPSYVKIDYYGGNNLKIYPKTIEEVREYNACEKIKNIFNMQRLRQIQRFFIDRYNKPDGIIFHKHLKEDESYLY